MIQTISKMKDIDADDDVAADMRIVSTSNCRSENEKLPKILKRPSAYFSARMMPPSGNIFERAQIALQPSPLNSELIERNASSTRNDATNREYKRRPIAKFSAQMAKNAECVLIILVLFAQ